jgi:sporulation protein YlmC with PRC-barrel domain
MRLELLVGRRVVGTNGRIVGRVEELRFEERERSAVVTGVCVGPQALLERLSAPVMELWGRKRGYLSRLDQIDLTDPQKPRLRVPVSELEPL